MKGMKLVHAASKSDLAVEDKIPKAVKCLGVFNCVGQLLFVSIGCNI